MGQATRNNNYKTKADGSLGIAGILFGAVNNAANQVRQTARVAEGVARRQKVAIKNPSKAAGMPPIMPSKPIPPPTAPKLGGSATNPDPLHLHIQNIYDSIAKGVGKIGAPFGAATKDSAYKQAQTIAKIQVPGKELFNEVSDAAKGLAHSLPGMTPYQKPADRPDRGLLDELEKQVDSALRDNTWTPEERMQIVQQYRNFVSKFTASDDEDLKALNNWAVKAEYKRLYQQWHNKTVDADSKIHADTSGDLWSSYSGTLSSEADDSYGPGFLLAQDEGGWYKIQNIQDVQHQIESEMRKNPAAAAQLIARMTAWGAYGGAQEKYSKNNVVFDKNGNPVSARWTKDDQAALKQFLADVAKDQETAMSAGELEPWDVILDQQSQRNDTIASSSGYGGGGGGGGGGYRRYGRRGYGGYGGGGGGGGGGVTYTDADQLKQLINGVARARLGMVLTDDQVNEFVSQYHQKEAAFVQARIAGQSGQQLDPESQAAAWIESHFRDSMAAQQGNSYISALASFLLTGSFGSNS